VKTFGEPIAAKQLVQAKLADCFVEYEKALLLAHYIGKTKDAGKLDWTQISVGKLNNVREAIRIASTCRALLGADGINERLPGYASHGKSGVGAHL
jgi:glutaryl-CoA dehydrogenase